MGCRLMDNKDILAELANAAAKHAAVELSYFDLLWGDLTDVVYRVADYSTISEILADLCVRKDRRYGVSWAKRGIIGYWTGCVARPMDRVEVGFAELRDQLLDAQPVDDSLVMSLMSTLADVANYAILGICLLAGLSPDTYRVWVEKVEKED